MVLPSQPTPILVGGKNDLLAQVYNAYSFIHLETHHSFKTHSFDAHGDVVHFYLRNWNGLKRIPELNSAISQGETGSMSDVCKTK